MCQKNRTWRCWGPKRRPTKDRRFLDWKVSKPSIWMCEASWISNVFYVDNSKSVVSQVCLLGHICMYTRSSTCHPPLPPPNGHGTPLPPVVGVCCAERGTRCSKCIEMYRVSIDCILRKPAGRLGKVVFANEVSIGGVGGGAWRGGQKNHRRLVIRVFFLQILEGHVPLGNFVTVGSDFPGFDSPQVPQNGKKNNHKLGRAWLSSPLLR